MSDISGPLISVIVCTRNRAELLGRTLTSVTEQKLHTAGYEILVVDNGSTDATPEIVEKFRSRATVRYVPEPRVGLCIARNTGWTSAAGRYVAYLDDDAIASPGWLAAIREGFESSGRVGVLGGPVRPIWERPRPDWLPDEIVCSLTVVDWGPADKQIIDITREWLVGANLAVPKALLAEVGGFHPWLDRIGNNLLSSGDIFLQKEVLKRGYECRYSPSMIVGHLVPTDRLDQSWFFRRYYWQGVSDAVMYLIENNPSIAERVRMAGARAQRVMRWRQGLVSLISRTGQPDTFATKCFALIDIGFISGLLGAARR